MPAKVLTWLRTSAAPETWSLGILRGERLYAICAEVYQAPTGWNYTRWRRPDDPQDSPRIRAGRAATRDAAMRVAAIDLITRVQEPVSA